MMDVVLSILAALPVTLLVTVASFTIGAVFGLPLVLGRRAKSAPLRWISKLIVDVLRGIPPIVFVFILFFGVGRDLIQWEPLLAAIVGLGLISAGHLAEAYRGGLMAVQHGQFEAASALGLGRVSTSTVVIGPQAIRTAIPAMVTWLISLLKDSSVVSAIGVAEMMFVTQQIARTSGDGIWPFVVAAAIYIAVGAPLAAFSRWLVARLSFGRRDG